MGAPLPPVFQQSPSHQKEEMHAGGRFCTRQKWNATLRRSSIYSLLYP